ncbi:hypothetical protein [Tengunoibacter tsumagoiensis]|uniref:Uncharacterized protein n=1 Tax=Tengunoibacter tsumagoiensis TaxID=2014871 RepID=A0A401ZUG0_9CHLR|nr:hypothetical protein [Tengunoibacter tsumagoiensis]GCE10549.1 hypothetical protein KTT_04080 [Tengunoibacter tsumagoiensis]
MTQDGESQPKRRSRGNTVGQDSMTTVPNYGRNISRTTSGASRNSEVNYELEDDRETIRQTSSMTRYNPPSATSSIPRITSGRSTANNTNSIPTRRQPSGMTRDIPRPPRVTTQTPRVTAQTPMRIDRNSPPPRAKRNVHWLVLVGMGMIAALALWVIGSAALSWGLQRYDDYRYGNPRTFQTDAVVGHNNDSAAHPSHFVAMNLHRQPIVVEIAAGDPGKLVSYAVAPPIVGDGGDIAPITLEFRDVTNDQKPDMIIHIHLSPQNDTVIVFVNDGTKFRPSTPNDHLSN